MDKQRHRGQKQEGLSVLLEATREYKEPFKVREPWQIPTTLAQHPFGLLVPAGAEVCLNLGMSFYASLGEGIRFAGIPGVTDISVNPMIAFIAREMAERGFGDGGKPVYLRTIFARHNPTNHSQHDVYYEIGFPHEVFLCGGCTDYSGEGGSGKAKMDSLFALLGDVFGIEVQRTVLPYERTQRAEKILNDAVLAKTQWFEKEWHAE